MSPEIWALFFMVIEDVIKTAIKELDTYPIDPTRCSVHDAQEVISIQKWTLKQILNELSWSDRIPAHFIVSDFAKKMDEFSCHDNPSAYKFSIAYDMAMCILDLLLTK